MVTVATFALDQFTKAEAFAYVARFGDLELVSFLTITAGTNSGVAFGMATAAHPLLLTGIAAVISVAVVLLMRNAHGGVRKAALGAILGGALGNIADRVMFGAVRDTIDLHWNGWHWPTFNLADAFIFIGVLVLVFRPERAPSKSESGLIDGSPKRDQSASRPSPT